ARDRQKSYADLKRKPMEFEVGDKVMLKVSPWKRVVRFGKQGKLNPRFVGPFKVIKRVGDVAYKLELPKELSRVRNTFHVSNLKKCHADEPLAIPLDGLHFDDKLQFVEEPIEITDREVKRLKRSRIPLVKVRWNSKRGPEFTWEREDQFKKKYPHLFAKKYPHSSVLKGQAVVKCCVLSLEDKAQLTRGDYNTSCFRTINTPRILIPLRPILGVLHFGSMIGMAIHEIPGMLGLYVMKNLDTEKNELLLSDSSILVNSQSVPDILEYLLSGRSIESLWNQEVHDELLLRVENHILFMMNFLMLFANTMGMCETSGDCNMYILKKIRDDVCVAELDWCSYIMNCLKESKNKWVNPVKHHYTGPLTFMILLYLHSTRCDHFDVIRQTPAIRYWKSGQMTYREKLEIEEYGDFEGSPIQKNELLNYNQREILNEGLAQYPDSKKLNLVRKRFEEYDADNDDTTGVNKDKNELPNCDSQIEEDGTENVDTTGKDNESDSPALSDDVEGDAVRLTEVEDVDINKKGVDSINEGDALGLAKVEGVDISEKVEKENQQIGNEESSSQMDEDSVNPSLNEVDKVDDSSHATVLDSVIEVNAATEEAEDVDMNENVENEKKKNGNEESSSQDFVHPILNEDDKVGDSSHATGVDSVIQGGDAAIETENVDINEKVENKKQKNSNEESSSQDFVYPSLNEDDKVGDSPHATCVDSVIGEDVDSQQTLEDNFKESEDFDDVKHDVYNGPDLRSPYEYLPVDVKMPITDVEKIVADTLFAMTGSKIQSGLELNHFEMETLTSTLMVSSNVIDVWAELLNILEVYKDESFPLRYYFKISVYIPEYYIGKYEDDEKLALFIAKMKESFNEDEKLMSLQNFQMVFFPVCHVYHIYLICVDFNKGSIHLIDNSSNGTDNKNQRYKGIPQAIKKVFVQYLYHVKHPKAEAIEKAKISRMNMKWRTTRNSTDCGVFTMFHMENYIGDWICGLDKESKQQNEQLKSLRSKFAAKIILSDFNLLREEFMKLVQVFQQKNEEERKKAIDDAIANRNDREKIEEAPIANKDECQKIEEANIPFENS
ncbi:putative reverse transcriptase domain-containing protein, partial [Tanacetum coccineum]